MIPRNELRIGNKVHSPYHNLLFATVEGMTTGPIVMLREVSTYDTFEGIEPIPLSPEILEACGFYKAIENAGNLPCWKRSKYTIAKWANNKWQMWIQTVDIFSSPQHLHELQNIIFALTGEELTVDKPIHKRDIHPFVL